MNPVRELVAKLGGILKTADHYGVSKTLIGKCCVSGEVYSLELALAMAADAVPTPAGPGVHTQALRLRWLESVSPQRRAA